MRHPGRSQERLVQLFGQYYAPAGDSDGDGLPDALDSYPGDASNNTFYWSGGAYTISEVPTSVRPGVLWQGRWAYGDGDGIPDVVDPYPADANNDNLVGNFWWDGGTFSIADETVHFVAGYYQGSRADSDGDGIPDFADPYPGDSSNGNDTTVWWEGGTFIIHGASQTLPGQYHSGRAGDADGRRHSGRFRPLSLGPSELQLLVGRRCLRVVWTMGVFRRAVFFRSVERSGW